VSLAPHDKLIIQSCDDNFRRYLDLSRPIHEEYAGVCGADYKLFIGRKDPRVHPAWNRIPMFLEAFAAGYQKVVWLDGDSLMVRPEVDIFAETDDTAPLQMIRVLDSHVELPWGEPGWDAYNDGVLVANNCEQSVEAFEYVWARRRAVAMPHHCDSLWERNWLLDWVFAHPESVALLDVRFNWMPFAENLHCEAEAVICSWHGMQHDERFRLFEEKFNEVYRCAAA
jgi:hypothetical protein